MQRDIFKSEISVFPCGWKRKDMHVVWTIEHFIAEGKHYETDINKARSIKDEAHRVWSEYEDATNNCKRAVEINDTYAIERWQDVADLLRQRYDTLMKQYSTIKSKLPSALMQGVNQERNNDVQQFQSFTDVLCIDIDAPKPDQPSNGNEWIPDNLDKLKQAFAKIPHIAYCGLSVGGKGLYLLIPIADHEHHRDYWQQIRTMFKEKFKIEIDDVTYNMGRLRCISYDETAIVNHHAVVWEKRPKPQPKQVQLQRVFKTTSTYNNSEDAERITKLANEIALKGIDITPSYGEWQQVAASIAHTMGESGRNVFHLIARQSPKYNEKENDRLYTSMMKPSSGRECTANTFYYICERHGLDIKQSKRAKYGPYVQRTTSTYNQENNVQRITSTQKDVQQMENKPTPTMSKAETMEMQRNWQRIKSDTEKLDHARVEVPALDMLCNVFDLHYNGNSDWLLTDAQFNAFNDLFFK